MDYEKKYKEALERARALRNEAIEKEYAVDYIKDYETIFPELRESEDERIRKELKEAFEAYDIESTWNGIPIRSIFAWLEKQKEPHYTKRNALFDKCVENCDPEVMKEVSDKVDEMLGKEQKPDDDPLDDPKFLKGFDTGREVQRIFDEQKPAEWSEEDDQLIGFIFDLLNSLVWRKEWAMDKKECLERLKSLRPSWKPSEK